MATIINFEDFANGDMQITQDSITRSNFNDGWLDFEKEKSSIYLMMGQTLGQSFIDDLSGNPLIPVTQKWKDVFTEFNTVVNDCPVYCVGVKGILKMIKYFDYTSNQTSQNTQNGNQSLRQEASEPQLVTKSTIFYNRSVQEIRKLHIVLNNDSNQYPNLKMYEFETITDFI